MVLEEDAVPEGNARLEDRVMLDEGAVPEGEARLKGGAMLEKDAVPEGDATTEVGAMPEGLRVKLAEGLVRKPVDTPVPVG